jgi:NADPH:quinone reductase-like Zn-dependent oxidoreductase
MKAAVHTEYGPAEVVKIQDVPKPSPGDDEVLVKIHSATVNRNDCGFRTPEYWFIRLFAGLRRPKKTILGTEFAGVVEALGKGVTSFKVGDPVFGLTGDDFGTHAEYVCVPEAGAMALKPTNMNFDEATSICDGPWLALNILKALDFKVSRKVLVNGASGSIGSSCVQLAKHYGAEVTAVCSTTNLEIVKALGADHLIDYTKEDFTKCGKVFDYVLDAVGKSSFSLCKPLMTENGVYISTELGPRSENPFLALWTPLFSKKQVKFPIPRHNKADILFIKDLVEKGKLKAVIDRRYPFDQIVEAHRFVEKGMKTGSVVLTIGS